MEIEHYITQNHHPESTFTPEGHHQRRLDFTNMLGTCKGIRSCSGIRGNTPLTIDPRNQSCERLIHVNSDGTITSSNQEIQNDINNTLQLNNQQLKQNRQLVIDKAREDLRLKAPNNLWDNNIIDKEITNWGTLKQTRHGMAYEEYCMAAIHYLMSKKK